MVLFTLGTGIGCGIIVGDLAIDGENSHGAECGHIHHRLFRKCPDLRLRPAGTPRGLRQRHGRGQTDAGGPGGRPVQFASRSPSIAGN